MTGPRGYGRKATRPRRIFFQIIPGAFTASARRVTSRVRNIRCRWCLPVLGGYSPKTLSLVTRVNPSYLLCAINMRSTGSLWCQGKDSVASAWSSEIWRTAAPLSRSSAAIARTGFGSFSFPKHTLIESSQRLTVLTNISLSGFLIAALALALRVGFCSICQIIACVSNNKRITSQYTTIFPEPRQRLVKCRKRQAIRVSNPWRIREANRQAA